MRLAEYEIWDLWRYLCKVNMLNGSLLPTFSADIGEHYYLVFRHANRGDFDVARVGWVELGAFLLMIVLEWTLMLSSVIIRRSMESMVF